jgi:carbamoyl-phosphate synthase large subunit
VDLERAGVPIIGTSPDSDRHGRRPRALPEVAARAGLEAARERDRDDADEAMALANEVGYPLVVRPSYVLGGRAMEIANNDKELERFMGDAFAAPKSSRCCWIAS